ncbi:hypothetical protein LTR84_011322 [Exophiala bonariae]|uniref:Major facilitator superfamily (MFS) profile domain-containing protein n=1 Tax=Exophiala bonariae TaxID=1690606 RepID=A0AAV9MUT4_9EURO|nr:hypothetical protein LTR84_011322 [Exophiala bonariae]
MKARARDQWNWRNFLMCFGVSTGMIAFSYPASIIGTTLAQPSFLSYMDLLNDQGVWSTQATPLIGAMSGIFQAGGIFGIIAATYAMEKWGRKIAVYLATGIGLLGGALVCASQNVGMFIAFKFLAGMSSWGFIAITPVYTSELAPPALRGLCVGMNGVGIALGYSLATYMGLAFFYSTNMSTQWRGPYGISLIFTALPALIVMFIPESPRWLLMSNRIDDAKQVVRRLHNLADHDEHHFAIAEYYQMQKQIEYDRTLDPSYWQLIKRPSYRKRVIMSAGYAALGQSTAILVINNYGPSLYSVLGYDTEQQLKLQCGWITCGIIGNLTGALIMDKVGRKPLMIFGIGGCLACLVVEAALVATYANPILAEPNKAALRAAVAAFYVFVFIYGCGVDVAGIVFDAEIYPNHLRPKGLALTVASTCLSSLIYLQVSPTAFANIGWKFYLVFICICTVGLVWIIIVLPETKGIPLEEVAALFGDQDEVMVYTADLQLGEGKNELVVREHQELEDEHGPDKEAVRPVHQEIVGLSA